eukprot:6188092-Pleurochrysis_carterae.AAC.5
MATGIDSWIPMWTGCTETDHSTSGVAKIAQSQQTIFPHEALRRPKPCHAQFPNRDRSCCLEIGYARIANFYAQAVECQADRDGYSEIIRRRLWAPLEPEAACGQP